MNRYIAIAIAFVVALVGGLAVAQGSGIVHIDRTPRAMQGGFYSGVSGTLSSGNRVTNMLATTVDWNFASGTIVCTESRPVTVTGASVGDVCVVGQPAAPQANSVFTCYVSAADTAYLRHCPVGSAADPGDAGYSLRIISAQ